MQTEPMNPNLDPIHFDYEFLLSASRAYNERNDCSVIATCVVSGEPYTKVHEMYRAAGRRRRCGTQWPTTVAVMAQLGLRMHDITPTYSGRTVRSVVPQLPKDARFFVKTAKHILGVVHGKAEDWSDERGLYVQHIFQILSTYEQDPPVVVKQDIIRGRWNASMKVSEIIHYFAEKELRQTLVDSALSKPPATRRFWLALRARVMAKCETASIKRTTASIELGKWQMDQGFDMRRLA